ncbi:TonB-dependent receptor [Phocaeicola sp. HCN-40430]|uniref:SusC/RagA family TonB-linked outer membrane protein n=1 Tax=Phocaeicola sp. HCN-40430 TaxID=3134664 RepID=UPI0030C2C908
MVSFIGLQTQEVAIKPIMKITLKSDSEMLDEVMVVAYGTVKKESFTGAAAAMNADKVLKDIPVTSFEQALQGSAPGVTVNASSGQPGAGLSIRVRGTGSMNASNDPLYVIDGVPVVSGDIAVSGISGDSKAFNVMASLNPEDIESITVLKDAAAASLYGSRAANGVIMISTKKGKEGKTRINFKATVGFSDWAVKNRETVNGTQQRELAYEAYYNEGKLYKNMSDEDAAAYAKQYTDVYTPELENYADWKGAMFRDNGFSQNYEFSAQGGNEKNTFYASLSYKNEEGMAYNSGVEGFNGRLNLIHKSSDNKFQVGASVTFSKLFSEMAMEGTSYNNPFWITNTYVTPNIPIYNEDGSFNSNMLLQNLKNPVENRGLESNTSDVFRTANSLWAQYEFIKGLTLKQTVSYDFILNTSETWWPSNSQNGSNNNKNGLMIKIPDQRQNLYSSTVLNYAQSFGKHSFDVLAGWDLDMRHREYVQAVNQNYPTDKLPEMTNASNPQVASSGYDNDRMLSFLSRVNYDYEHKYYASVNYRRDGSSRLGKNQRWANFWSVSAAWRISQESFMKNLSFIDDLKLRASYGVNGTLPTDLTGHMQLIGYGYNYMKNPGSLPVQLANPDLSWEKNYNFNIGFDARLFNRVGITFDFYNRNTKDLLQELPVSYVTGFSSILKNVGEINNRGVEVDINVDMLKDCPVAWNMGLNLSHNKNEVKKLYGGKDIIDGTHITREGESVYAFYSREWAGVDPQTGEEMWVLNTTNEDGSLNKELTKDPSKAQRIIVGKADPTIIGGWRNSVSWKGLEMNALFTFSLGGHLWDEQTLLYTSTDGATPYLAQSVDQLDRWQKPGDVTDVPRRIANYEYSRYGSSRVMESSNYLRLKTLSISYSLPSKWVHSAKMNSVRVFFSGNNLLTWRAYDNIDPEQPVNGFVSWAFPALKTFTFGIEIGL